MYSRVCYLEALHPGAGLTRCVCSVSHYLKQENLKKLAAAKANFVSEVFGRVQESVLQLQTFAEQAISTEPDTLVVDSYLDSNSGLEQLDDTFENSVWCVSSLETGFGGKPGVATESPSSQLMHLPPRARLSLRSVEYHASPVCGNTRSFLGRR